MDEGTVVAALLRGSPEVARSLTMLDCWPSDSFAVVYDELARQGHLHHLLLRVQHPVLLLEDLLVCGGGSDAGRARLIALTGAVSGRPTEASVLAVMLEVERRARRLSDHRLCLVKELCAAGATGFARKLDAYIAHETGYTELSVLELLGFLQRDDSSVSTDAIPEQLPAGVRSHVRRAVLHELCRRSCSRNCDLLDGISQNVAIQMLRYACPDMLVEPRASSKSSNALPPTAIAILHVLLCGTSQKVSVDMPRVLCDRAGGTLLYRFVRGVVLRASYSWQHAHQNEFPSATASYTSRKALASVFQYVTSVQKLLVTRMGRRVLWQVAEEHQSDVIEQGSATTATREHDCCHDPELSFSWVGEQNLHQKTCHDTLSRWAYLWLLLTSRNSQTNDIWPQWHAAVGDPSEGTGAIATQATASQLRSTLAEILDLVLWPNDKRLQQGERIKRRRLAPELNTDDDDASVKHRYKHNLPLLGCLHSIIDLLIGSVHNLPNLHNDAVELCNILLDAFDAILIDVVYFTRLREPLKRCELAETGSKVAVDQSSVYENCSIAILQLVHSICTFVNGLDEDCCTFVWKHHSELILSRFARLGGVPAMRVFALIAVQVSESMFAVDPAANNSGKFDERQSADLKERHAGQLWRLYGEIIVQLRRWHTSLDEENEADVLSTDCLSSLLAEPARKLVHLQSKFHDNLARGVVKQTWCIGVVEELLLFLQHRTESTDCSAILVSVLEALAHLVSQQSQQELAALWEPGGGTTTCSSSSNEQISTSAMMKVMITCANLLRINRNGMKDRGSVEFDRCCFGAVNVILGLLRATAMTSSEEMQHLSIGAMIAESSQTTTNTTDVITSLIEHGFADGLSRATTTATCARCLQYFAGAHDTCAVAVLENNGFADKLLAQVVARMDQVRQQRTVAQLTEADEVVDNWQDICELISSVSGLLALCAERTTSLFWRQFGNDLRFFTMLRCMLETVVLPTVLSSVDRRVSSHVITRAATHALRLAGNVADAAVFASKLNLAGVPQSLQNLADNGIEVGLSTEGCARVAQMVRAISS